jgi:hypothetical protein
MKFKEFLQEYTNTKSPSSIFQPVPTTFYRQFGGAYLKSDPEKMPVGGYQGLPDVAQHYAIIQQTQKEINLVDVAKRMGVPTDKAEQKMKQGFASGQYRFTYGAVQDFISGLLQQIIGVQTNLFNSKIPPSQVKGLLNNTHFQNQGLNSLPSESGVNQNIIQDIKPEAISKILAGRVWGIGDSEIGHALYIIQDSTDRTGGNEFSNLIDINISLAYRANKILTQMFTDFNRRLDWLKYGAGVASNLWAGMINSKTGGMGLNYNPLTGQNR